MKATVILAMATLGACVGGDNRAPCDVNRYQWRDNQTAGCAVAYRVAAFESPTVVLEQAHLDKYVEKFERALAAEPLLANSLTSYEGYRPGSLDIMAPAVWDHWQRFGLYGFSPEYDNLVDAAGLALNWGFSPEKGVHLTYDVGYNPKLMDEVTKPFGFRTVKVQGPYLSQYNTHTTWDGTTMILHADARIATCPDFCWPVRHFRAVVSETDVVVYDLGGDRYPSDGPQPQPTTIPMY